MEQNESQPNEERNLYRPTAAHLVWWLVLIVVICVVVLLLIVFLSSDGQPRDKADMQEVDTAQATMEQGSTIVMPSTVPESTGAGEGSVSSTSDEFMHLEKVSLYTDDVLGISFAYPEEWGQIEVRDERGDCPEAYLTDSCNQRILKFSGIRNGEIFLAAETSGHQMFPVGRDGFWGDNAFAAGLRYREDCGSSSECLMVQVASGVVFAKYREQFFDWVDWVASVPDLPLNNRYVLGRPTHEYSGIILSPIRIKSNAEDVTAERRFEETVIKTFTTIN